MKKIGLFLLSSVVVVSFISCASTPDAESMAKMEKAKQLFEQRADVAKAKEGVALFQEIIEKNPQYTPAFELLSRLTVYLCMDLASNKKTAMEAYEYMGVAGEVTDAWLKFEPNSGPANFWKAYSAAAAKDIKTALIYGEKAIEIDPNYLNGSPYTMMGYLKGVLPPFLGGDLEAAYKYLDKAMEAAPDNLMIHRIKALLLVNEAKAAAKKAMVHLQFVVESPPMKGWGPEARRDKAVAKKLLGGYGKGLKVLAK
ncbi:MAG: TRAP transporter TatT component family protein [Spirochaetota bacterium]|nr:TRAP transporter TatT component family protein [Spirochaetota bacterium]